MKRIFSLIAALIIVPTLAIAGGVDIGGLPVTAHSSKPVVALTAGAAVSLTVQPGRTVYTDTTNDNEDQTITFSGVGSAGDEVIIVFTTTSTADEVITFHATNVASVGTLTLGTTAARYYTVSFVSDGTRWREVARTAVQT